MASHEKLMILPVLGAGLCMDLENLPLSSPKQYCFSSLIVEDSSGKGEDRGMQLARGSKVCSSCDGQSFFCQSRLRHQGSSETYSYSLAPKVAKETLILGKPLKYHQPPPASENTSISSAEMGRGEEG